MREHLDYLNLPPPPCCLYSVQIPVFTLIYRQIDLLGFFHWSVFGKGVGSVAHHSDRTGPGIGACGFQVVVVWVGRSPPCDQGAGTAECRVTTTSQSVQQSVTQCPVTQFYSCSIFNHNYISDFQSHSDRGRRAKLKAKFFII